MIDHPYLTNAPIVEALFDVRITCDREFSVDVLASAKERLADEYPLAKKRSSFKTMLLEGGRPAPHTEPESKLVGYLFLSKDEKTIVQFRIDGFTFNRLAPYTSWEDLYPQAMRAFSLYTELAPPFRIDRAAVRYINRLQMQLPITNMAEYLTSLPPVPDGLPTEVWESLSRVVTIDSAKGLMCAVGHQISRSEDPRLLTVIVDIDTFCQRTIAPGELQEIYCGLRELKNTAFFSCVTEKQWGQYR